MKEKTLASGAVLKIGSCPFSVSKALYQAILKEARVIDMPISMGLPNLLKNLFCAGFSSPEIERCLWECMKRCFYNNVQITEQVFEPEAAREDYVMVCVEVATENLLPFMKGLYAEFQRVSAMTDGIPG